MGTRAVFPIAFGTTRVMRCPLSAELRPRRPCRINPSHGSRYCPNFPECSRHRGAEASKGS